MDEARLWETLGRIEGAVNSLTDRAAAHEAAGKAKEERLSRVERKVHTVWIFGGTAGGAAVLLLVEKIKRLLGM